MSFQIISISDYSLQRESRFDNVDSSYTRFSLSFSLSLSPFIFFWCSYCSFIDNSLIYHPEKNNDGIEFFSYTSRTFNKFFLSLCNLIYAISIDLFELQFLPYAYKITVLVFQIKMTMMIHILLFQF